jgi:hypothetical protein
MVFYVKNEEKNLKKRQDNFKNLLNVFQRYSVTPSSPSSFFRGRRMSGLSFVPLAMKPPIPESSVDQ